MSSESILQFLSQPATLASLAAITAAGMMFATRPTPLKCPVDPNQQSVEVPVSSSGSRQEFLELFSSQDIFVIICIRMKMGQEGVL